MKLRSLGGGVIAAAFLAIGAGAWAETPPVTTIFIIRHAEQVATDAKDPPLADAGRARAHALLHALKDANISGIFASQYERTRQTVEPLATALGLEVQQVDARDTAALVNRVLGDYKDKTVVICGHSNTVPDIIKAFGGEHIRQLSEKDFDNLYVVTRYRSGDAHVLRLNYGTPDGTP